MSEQTGISFSIGSSADTRGFIEATTGISNMADAERRREEVRRSFLSAAEREVAEVNRLAEASQRSATSTSVLTREEIEAAQALGRSTREFNEATLARLRAGQAARSAGLDMSKMGMLGNQASYQIGDFVTQVQMGTSAARAFSQQAPQLIGTFTSLGLVSGGLGMALGGVAVAIPLVTMLFERFTNQADTLKPKIEEINKAVEKNSDLLTKAYEAHVKDMDAADAAAQKWDDLTAAKNSAAIANLSNAQKELQAYEALNDALGIQVDLIGAKADLERSAREEAARQKTQFAANEAAGSAGEVAATMSKINDMRSEVARWRAEAEKKDKEAGVLQRMIRDAETGGFNTDAATLDRARTLAEANAIREAMRTLEGQIQDLERRADAQTAKANDKIKAADEAIAEIGQTLDADNSVGMAQEIRDRAKRQAEDLKGVLSGISPLNDAQQLAYDALQKIASDGKVTADESAAMAANLAALMEGVKTGLSNYNGTMKMLVGLSQQLVANDAEYRTLVVALQGKVGDMAKQIKELERSMPR